MPDFQMLGEVRPSSLQKRSDDQTVCLGIWHSCDINYVRFER
jgi:hypothetical protein